MELLPSAAAARQASLRYADCHSAGIRRLRRGKGFTYTSPTGDRINDRAELARIVSLAIPPAWRDVWISTSADGHLQATGVDARGRKQYRYHPDWTAHRNNAKFTGLADFARVLPAIRRRVKRDLVLVGMPKHKVLACIVHLLDTAHIRIGNDEYAKANKSYGLTTIRNNHAKVRGDEIAFNFRAKSGKRCDLRLRDPAAARIVRRCQDLPGQELFSYLDEKGEVGHVTSTDVNEYLQTITELRITAKDFRTWGGTVVAAQALVQMGSGHPARSLSEADLKRHEITAVRAAANALGNTVATCRKFYIHPVLIEANRNGRLHETLDSLSRSSTPRGLRQVERALTHLLRTELRTRRRAA